MECDGILVNSSEYGKCFCECPYNMDIRYGEVSSIGVIAGIRVNDHIVTCYVLLIIIIIVTILVMVEDICFSCLNRCKKLFLCVINRESTKRCYNSILIADCPASGWFILIGLVVGLFLSITSLGKLLKNELLTYNDETLFLFLVPPIIFEAGYNMDLRYFYSYIGLIGCHAIFGTLLQFSFFGLLMMGINHLVDFTSLSDLELFLFSAIISAVDPVSVLSVFKNAKVNERLNILVSSESILNDAVSITLYGMFIGIGIHTNHIDFSMLCFSIVKFIYVSVIGISIGVFFGAITVVVLSCCRLINRTKEWKDEVHFFKVSIVIGFSFLAYFIAESFLSSGILSILVCGFLLNILGKRFIPSNIRESLEMLLFLFSKISESLIFIYLGIGIFYYTHAFNGSFIVLSNIFLLILRFFSVCCISCSYNVTVCCRRSRNPIPLKEITVHACSGIRGGIAFALSTMIPLSFFDSLHIQEIVVVTMSVVLFTVFCQGTCIGSIIGLLNIEKQRKTTRAFVEDLVRITKYLLVLSSFLSGSNLSSASGINFALFSTGSNYTYKRTFLKNIRKLREVSKRATKSVSKKKMYAKVLKLKKIEEKQKLESIKGGEVEIELKEYIQHEGDFSVDLSEHLLVDSDDEIVGESARNRSDIDFEDEISILDIYEVNVGFETENENIELIEEDEEKVGKNNGSEKSYRYVSISNDELMNLRKLIKEILQFVDSKRLKNLFKNNDCSEFESVGKRFLEIRVILLKEMEMMFSLGKSKFLEKIIRKEKVQKSFSSILGFL